MRKDTDQPYNGTAPFVFVSYARDDAQTVVPIIQAMRSAGARVWWDQGVQPGQRFGDEIERRLDECEAVVVFLSARALQSDWILEETKHALENGKQLVPVLLDGSSLPLEWKSLIGRIQHIAGERRSATSIAGDITIRAKELGCLETNLQREGTTEMRSSNQTNQQFSNQAQSKLLTIFAVVSAIGLTFFATLYFTGKGSGSGSSDRESGNWESSNRFGSRSSSSSNAPEVPSSYLANLGGESRAWTWSRRSAMDNNSVTLHWEECKGVENMGRSNVEELRGSVDDVRRNNAGLPLRACRFCYEIEFNRKMREARNGVDSGASGKAPNNP